MQNRRELEKIYHNYNDISRPDADFNPARNKAVIEETIRKATAYHKSVHEALDESMGERIEAVAQYGIYRLGRGGTKNPDDYFGRKWMSKFAGEHLISKLKAVHSAEKLRGKSKNLILL